MIWSNTLRIGCAVNTVACHGGGEYAYQLICLYSPEGNFNNQPQYLSAKSGTPAACSYVDSITSTAAHCSHACSNGGHCTSHEFCTGVKKGYGINYGTHAVTPHLPSPYQCLSAADCFHQGPCCATPAFSYGYVCALGLKSCPAAWTPTCHPACAAGKHCVGTNTCTA